MLIGLAINFLNIDPIKALIYSAVANGVISPVILVLIVLISRNKKIMGEKSNHGLITFFGWMATLLMLVSGIAAIISLV